MVKKREQPPENKNQKKETWRKPLQVPPRENAMRSFYQGDAEEDKTPENPKSEKPQIRGQKKSESAENKQKKNAPQTGKREVQPKVKAEPEGKTKTSQTGKPAADQSKNQEDSVKLTEEELSGHLGFEAGDLFDVHELLRGKSFDIYQNLLESCDDTGRCKITQPELMARTGIKNRRTFYKHEERLLNLKLLEKRHLPGDHQGVVYRVFKIGEVLPIPQGLLEQFESELKENA